MLFIKKPIATVMTFVAVFVLGVYSCLHLPLELLPREEFPQLKIETLWPGIPPEVVHTRITSRLEEISSGLKGVRKVVSESRFGTSTIILDFDVKTNMEFARLALKENITAHKDSFPYGVSPRITSYVPEEFKEEPFLVYTVSGSHPLEKLRELISEKVEAEIDSLDGVAGIRVDGGADPEIRVILDKEKLKDFRMTPSLVQSRIQKMMGSYLSGSIKWRNRDCVLRATGADSGIRRLRETVMSYSGKRPVRLRNIAQVFPSYGDIRRINRINGQPAIGLIVFKKKGASTLRVAKTVKKRIEVVKRKLPQDLHFRVISDESGSIRRNLGELCFLSGIISILVFILVSVFLKGIGPSLLIISSVVLSVFVTFNLIYFFKLSLNMLTLGGLALGFGLFVDNSIVVFENILRLRQRGLAPVQSAVQGAREVFLPVLASTLTTVSVFFSFAYFQGRMRVYYLPLAFVIASALSASLFVSFSLIPALSPLLLKKIKDKRDERFGRKYACLLKTLFQHPLFVVFLIVAVFLGTFRWFRSRVVLGEFLGWTLRQTLQISILMPAGSPLETTDGVIRRFEERILAEDFCKEVRTTVEPERAWIIIRFPPDVEYSHSPWILKQALIQFATQFAGIGVGIFGLDHQGYFASSTGQFSHDSRMRISGYNLKKLKEITAGIERLLRRNPRVKRVRTMSGGRFSPYRDSSECVLRIGGDAFKHFNINPQNLNSYLQIVTRGHPVYPLKVEMKGKKIPVALRFSESDGMEGRGLMEELFQTGGGAYLRMKAISSLEQKKLPGMIERENQQFKQIIAWEFKGPHKAAAAFERSVSSNIDLPPGFTASMDDSGWEITPEEKGGIKFAILLSLLIIFMILASLFESFLQPFVILLTVPLALIGVFLAFIMVKFPFDSSAYTGIILMAGIVVNNSILLVDGMNKKKKKHSLQEATLAGARERIRPIVLTASTTVLGMLPLVLIQYETGRRYIWSSLALSTLGGLVSSTLFSLIVVPVLFFSAWRLKAFSERCGAFRKALRRH